MSMQSQHSGHRTRLRKRFLETGVSGFSEHELLELLLFYSLPRVNTNEIAHSLIDRFGSLAAVLSADSSKLSEVRGISSSSAVFLNLIYDMCGEYVSSTDNKSSFTSSDDISNWFISYFNAINSRICLLLSIGMKLELLGTVSLPADSLLSGNTSPRELAEIALRNKMNRIIISINHPDQLPVPDENDYRITNFITNTLSPLGIEICDCIICGGGKSFSMRSSGAFSFTEKGRGLL